MKHLPCSNVRCSDRRLSWSLPYQPRGIQYVGVPDDYEGPVYCSISCAIETGDFQVRIPVSTRRDYQLHPDGCVVADLEARLKGEKEAEHVSHKTKD